jgi:hypothetical protein
MFELIMTTRSITPLAQIRGLKLYHYTASCCFQDAKTLCFVTVSCFLCMHPHAWSLSQDTTVRLLSLHSRMATTSSARRKGLGDRDFMLVNSSRVALVHHISAIAIHVGKVKLSCFSTTSYSDPLTGWTFDCTGLLVIFPLLTMDDP